MPNAPARLGRIKAPRESIRPSRRTIRNSGITITWNGTINVARINTNATSRPKNLIRANAYPARLQKNRFPITTTTVTMSVLTNQRTNGVSRRTST